MIMSPIYLLILAAIAAVCLWFGRGPRDEDKSDNQQNN